MKKIDVKRLIVTSLIVLLPMVIGVVFWQQLPERLPTHFGLDGGANGFSSKAEAVYLVPFVMLGLHIFAVVVTSLDPKAQQVSPKVRRFIYWLIPVINLVIQVSVYGGALGWLGHSATINIGFSLLGLLFLVIGNYLPKTKQNFTVGLRLPWTLNSEENWNKTHRFAGKIWTVGGLILFLSGVTGWVSPYIFGLVFTSIVVLPIVYSYRLSRLE